MNRFRKILLLPMCGLGDAICYLPTLEVLRKYYPEAELTVLVATAPAGRILQASSAQAEVIVFNRGGRQRGWAPLLNLVRQLRRRRFDVVISGAHPDSLRIPILARLSGAEVRVGSSGERLSFLYSRRINVPTDAHYNERYRRLLEGIDLHISHEDFQPSLDPDPRFRERAEQLWREAHLDTGIPVVGIISGADTNARGNWEPHLKRWNNAGYAEVVKWLDRELGAKVIMIGTAGEAELADQIASLSNVRIVNFCGKTDLSVLPWLIKRCAVVIGNDTGTMHMAGALQSKMVSLFGPTSPLSFRPPGQTTYLIEGKAPCSPCYPNPTCDKTRCLAIDSISPEQVIEGIRTLVVVTDRPACLARGAE